MLLVNGKTWWGWGELIWVGITDILSISAKEREYQDRKPKVRSTKPGQIQDRFSLESNKNALEKRQVPWKRPGGQQVRRERWRPQEDVEVGVHSG